MLKRTFAIIIGVSISSIVMAADMKSRIQEWKTDEGARVLFIEAPEIPMVDLIISMDAGSFREGKNHGLASMTSQMMTLGTKDKDENEFSEALENLGSAISISSGVTNTAIKVRSLTDDTVLNSTLSLWREMVQEPRFDAEIFNRERTQSIDAQKARLDSPDAIASETFSTLLYPNQIQGVTSEMLQASLKKMKIEELKQFRDDYYHATGANIIIVGALDRDAAEKISTGISEVLGKGKALPKIEEKVEKVKPQTVRKYFNSPQSRIVMGHVSIDRFSPDYWPLLLGNHVLGGSGLTSLLMMDIREKQGLTYGIYSYFAPSFLHGPFTIGLSTKNESVDHAIKATIEGTKNFIKNGPNDTDLDRAKNNLIGSSILSLSSNSGLAGALLTIAQYDLPLDYYDTYPETIRAITKEEIQKAFQKHVHPDDFVTVIVGGEAP